MVLLLIFDRKFQKIAIERRNVSQISIDYRVSSVHSIISHRVVSIKQRFERISKTARATLIYIGFCRSFENMIRNLLEYFVIYRRMRTFEFREIDEPLCVSRSRIIDRVEARTEKIASQKFRSRGGRKKR